MFLLPQCRGCKEPAKIVKLDDLDGDFKAVSSLSQPSSSSKPSAFSLGLEALKNGSLMGDAMPDLCSRPDFQDPRGVADLNDFARSLTDEEEALEQAETLLAAEARRPPESLKVIGKSEKIDGIYSLVKGSIINGCPTWLREPPHPMVIYANAKGKWSITLPSGVENNRAFMKVNSHHAGLFPHEMSWGITNQGVWRPLHAVCVSDHTEPYEAALVMQQSCLPSPPRSKPPTIVPVQKSTAELTVVQAFSVSELPLPTVVQPSITVTFRLKDLLEGNVAVDRAPANPEHHQVEPTLESSECRSIDKVPSISIDAQKVAAREASEQKALMEQDIATREATHVSAAAWLEEATVELRKEQGHSCGGTPTETPRSTHRDDSRDLESDDEALRITSLEVHSPALPGGE